jgi:hydrogenase maturation factor
VILLVKVATTEVVVVCGVKITDQMHGVAQVETGQYVLYGVQVCLSQIMPHKYIIENHGANKDILT